jgi:hypothetical protein
VIIVDHYFGATTYSCYTPLQAHLPQISSTPLRYRGLSAWGFLKIGRPLHPRLISVCNATRNSVSDTFQTITPQFSRQRMFSAHKGVQIRWKEGHVKNISLSSRFRLCLRIKILYVTMVRVTCQLVADLRNPWRSSAHPPWASPCSSQFRCTRSRCENQTWGSLTYH